MGTTYGLLKSSVHNMCVMSLCCYWVDIYTLGISPLAIPTLPSCANGLPHLIFFMLTALLKFEWDLIIEGVKFSFVLFSKMAGIVA